MINFMHQTGECRWNQPLVTDQPMIFKLGTCTSPSLSQRSNPLFVKYHLRTHTATIDFQLTSVAKTTKSIRPDQTLNARPHQIQRSRLPYVYMHAMKRRKENEKRFFHSHRSKKEYQYKYSSGLSVSEEISELVISKKEKSLLVSLIGKPAFFGLR